MSTMIATPKEIGKAFQEAREEKGLSREEAGHQSKIHTNVIYDLETGVFDRLGKPYIKGFLKKYSAFLGLNTEDILKQYEAASVDAPGLEFALDIEPSEKESESIFAEAPNEKNIQMILVGVLSVVLVVMLFVLVGVIRSRMSNPRSVPVRTEARSERTAPVERAQAPAPVVERNVTRTTSEPEYSNAPVTLKLKARGDAWVQVKSGETTLYAGTLKEGQSRTWRGDGVLTVWTGKGENLDFYVNTRRIGSVAAGVVKNIKVSAKGINIGGVWVNRLD